MKSKIGIILAFGLGCFIVSSILPGGAFSAPQVVSLSGVIADGVEITIHGSGFANTGPDIALFDNFEGGSQESNIQIGSGSATIGQWTGISGSSPPVYDGTYSVSGHLAMRSDFQLNWSSDIRANISATDVFVSYWVMLPNTSYFPGVANPQGDPYNWKVLWLYGKDAGDDDIILPACYDGSEPYSGWAVSSNDAPSPPNWFDVGWDMYKGRWYRISAWVHGTSTSGTSEYELWVLGPDGTSKKVDNRGTQFDASTGLFEILALGAYGRQCGDGYECQPRFDDIYCAVGPNAKARVEIGNNSNYNQSTRLAILTVTSWSDTSIKATVQRGSFTAGENAYLFVVDATGNVNAAGYPVTINGASLPPQPPLALRVVEN